MNFRITGLSPELFTPLFSLSDAELQRRDARRLRVPDGAQLPCRVSLTDAQPGDEVLLVNHEHHAVASPYRARFAIFVREGERRFDATDTVPAQLRTRLLAVRAYDSDGMLREYDIVAGARVDSFIERFFATTSASYLHVHFAKAGCYAALVERA
jgi:hypothetical protein